MIMQHVGYDIIARHPRTSWWLTQHKLTLTNTMHTQTRVSLQFEHSRTLAQHHLDEVSVVDSVAAAARHLHNHFLQFQVGLGHTQLLHHPLETHQI